MINLGSAFPWIAAIIGVLGLAGGAVLIRRLTLAALSAIQERVIAALREENKTQADQIVALRAELAGLRDMVATLRLMLKRRGLTVRINGDLVTIIDVGVPKETTVRIKKDTVTEITTADDSDENVESDST